MQLYYYVRHLLMTSAAVIGSWSSDTPGISLATKPRPSSFASQALGPLEDHQDYLRVLSIMGIPKFFRWVSERYPLINQQITDLSLLPEFDNLYLDMNGIIHACTHPHDQDVGDSLKKEDMILGIFAYIDRIVSQIVRPKKLLYLAIDGVAPRAKLNQQRSRRFRSAKDQKESLQARELAGETVDKSTLFDSNCITPGTAFMAEVSKHLVYFVRKKIKEDPVWQGLEIIYSGHEVPGEGEHKIMEYIRNTKMQPNYNPNLRHCLYGQDADLMMLALASHEPHFTLLREVIDFNRGRANRGNNTKTVMKQTKETEWQLLHISILREYLMFDFHVDVDFYDPERAIDDFVFMAFLVGNDFIPHSPLLDIGEGAFPLLFKIYKELLPGWGGFLTKWGEIEDPHRLESFFAALGAYENEIFAEREREKAIFDQRSAKRSGKSAEQIASMEEESDFLEAQLQAEFEKALQEAGVESSSSVALGDGNGQKDWKGRYYYEKFGITVLDVDVLKKVKRCFLESLIWCAKYYYQGVCSWTWFYPFHYAPMISDLVGIADILQNIKLPMGEPFLPFEQLLGCLPPASATFLPQAYRQLITSDLSPISDYYPLEFKVDMNGKRNPWEGVNLLPFIDAARLRDAVRENCPDTSLTAQERQRNRFGTAFKFVYDSSVTSNVASTYPEAGLPDIIHCFSRMEPYSHPPSAAGGFIAYPPEGVIIPYPGFPSLKTRDIANTWIGGVKVNVFGFESKYETLVVDLQSFESDAEDGFSGAAAGSVDLIGESVWVNWPFLLEGKVVAVSDEGTSYSARHDSARTGGLPYLTNTHTAEAARRWKNESIEFERKYLHGCGAFGYGGCRIGVVNVKVTVKLLQGMEEDPRTGGLKKTFGQNLVDYPLQLVLTENPAVDPRFVERELMPVEERFPAGCQVIGRRGEYKGCLGTVIDHRGGTAPSLAVEYELRSPEPPFGVIIAERIQDRYYPAGAIASKLGITPELVGNLTGQVSVKPGRKNIGLGLKVRKSYQILGYARYRENGSSRTTSAWTEDSVRIVGSSDDGNDRDNGGSGTWEYSDKVAQILVAYQRKFPAVFLNLARLGYIREYTVEEIFHPAPRNEAARLFAELEKWLAQLETAKAPLVPVSTKVMSRDAVRAVEAAVERLTTTVQTRKVLVDNVAAEDVFVPSGNDAKLFQQVDNAPYLGARVSNLTAKGVPFGHRGTVVACHPDTNCVDVVYDREFLGGSTLHGLCHKYKGKLVTWHSQLLTSEGSESAVQERAQSTPAGRPMEDTQKKAEKVRKGSKKASPQSVPDSGTLKILAKSGSKPASQPVEQTAKRGEMSAAHRTPAVNPKQTASTSDYWKVLEQKADTGHDGGNGDMDRITEKLHFQSLLHKAGLNHGAPASTNARPKSGTSKQSDAHVMAKTIVSTPTHTQRASRTTPHNNHPHVQPAHSLEAHHGHGVRAPLPQQLWVPVPPPSHPTNQHFHPMAQPLHSPPQFAAAPQTWMVPPPPGAQAGVPEPPKTHFLQPRPSQVKRGGPHHSNGAHAHQQDRGKDRGASNATQGAHNQRGRVPGPSGALLVPSAHPRGPALTWKPRSDVGTQHKVYKKKEDSQLKPAAELQPSTPQAFIPSQALFGPRAPPTTDKRE